MTTYDRCGACGCPDDVCDCFSGVVRFFTYLRRVLLNLVVPDRALRLP